ncbi:MAG: RNA-guided endonuclease InsQ/TnpB family protein [Acetobacteraceae bacterium]
MTAVLQAATGRLYPSASQARTMARIGGQCRALWNHWLAVSRERYGAEGKFAFYAEMSAALPAMRKEDRYAGLPHRCAQMTVQKLDRALRECGKKAAARKGFPRFKRRDDRRDAFQFVGREVCVEPGRIKVPALGWLRVRGLRVPDVARLVQATIRQQRGGWGLSLQFEGVPPVYPAPVAPIVGIDVGLANLIALSDGTRIAPPRLLRKRAGRFRRLERQKARRRKGSVNRRRTGAALNRAHGRLAASRRDFAHKLSRALIDRHEGIAVEKLRLKGLMRTRLAKSFADAGLAELIRQLRYKAEWAGRDFREMPTFQRSTGVCPACGEVGARLPLAIREWRCAGCGAMHDRDVAAAQVILCGAVPPVRRELVGACRRKRGAAVRHGLAVPATSSGGRPPANVDEARATGLIS